MTTPPVNQNQDNKPSDKELNFRALERRTQEAERRAQEAERALQEKSKPALQEEDDDSEPYVDNKKLNKKLARHSEMERQETSNQINQAVNYALKEERKQSWIKNNPDFYETLQHAEKFAAADPELAETILEMPEGFERQKLVYKSIKALGIHKPILKEPSVQEKIDANRRGPYYQPTGTGMAPYSSQSDYSQTGQKEAYAKMQELKNRLRL